MKKLIKTKAFKKTATFLVVIIVIFLTAKFAGSGKSKSPTTSYEEINALRDSESFIAKRLKSPSTAKFISTRDFLREPNHVKRAGKNTFLIDSWVDSQNGFGATVRSNYTCKIIVLPLSKQIKCKNIVIK